MAHTHLAARSPGLAQAARASLETQGVQWTDLRAAVYGTLAESAAPLSAYDVAEIVSRRLGRRIAANSVYRILDLFVAHNAAKRIESRNAYIANSHPACTHDCIFLVCDGCGRIDHLDDDALANAMRDRAATGGFVATRPVLELIGRCATCQPGTQANSFLLSSHPASG